MNLLPDDAPSEANFTIGDVLREISRRQLADVSEAQLDMMVDTGAIELGDVLGEIARRQLADADPLDVAEVKLDMLVDLCYTESSQMLEETNQLLEEIQTLDNAQHYRSVVNLAKLLKKFDAKVAEVDADVAETREKIRRARQERRRGAAADAVVARVPELSNRTALADLRAAAKSQAKALALAWAAAIERDHSVIWMLLSLSVVSMKASLLLVVAMPPSLQWTLYVMIALSLTLYLKCMVVFRKLNGVIRASSLQSLFVWGGKDP
jgi:hypothetical protein